MRLPNFIIIGAAKCGTTALYEYLCQHPDIYMSAIKEPKFFALEGEEFQVKKILKRRRRPDMAIDHDSYTRLFSGVTSEKAIGEASSVYLRSPIAPRAISKYIPECKLIVVLRDPVDRAYSEFLMRRRNGHELIRDFSTACKKEVLDWSNKGNSTIWDRAYIHSGLYYKHLQAYLEYFDPTQMRVYFSKDLKNQTDSVLKDIYTFLGVSGSNKVDTSATYNERWIQKNWLLEYLLVNIWVRISKAKKLKEVVKSIIPPKYHLAEVRDRNKKIPRELRIEERKELLGLFRDDTLRLQKLVKRDLSDWLR